MVGKGAGRIMSCRENSVESDESMLTEISDHMYNPLVLHFSLLPCKKLQYNGTSTQQYQTQEILFLLPWSTV